MSRGSKRFSALIVAGLMVAASGTVGLAFYSEAFKSAFEEKIINLKRAAHRVIYSWGFDLPGTPDLDRFDERLQAAGFVLGAPVFIRIFKREFELEVWLHRNGRFERFATYPVCRWSGRLGPKMITGDKQAPEGFYSVDAGALNPQSKWHRSFNLGFPNAYDRAKGRSGAFLMVHGGCGSIGCYAMTNAVIDEIWKLVEGALRNGQKRFQVQVLPFRLTPEALERHAGHPSAAFWRDLKPGYDLFEQEAIPPRVSVCHGRYQFQSGKPSLDGSLPIVAACH